MSACVAYGHSIISVFLSPPEIIRSVDVCFCPPSSEDDFSGHILEFSRPLFSFSLQLITWLLKRHVHHHSAVSMSWS